MDGNILRVVGIDPGSQSLGFSYFEHNIETNDPRLKFARTFHAESVMKTNPRFDIFGVRGKRLRLCGEFITRRLEELNPHIVCCEDAYLGRFPAAFRSLVEGVVCIQNAVYAWNENTRLWLVDPPTAKIAVGAPGRGGGKDAVRDALLKNKDFASEVEVDLLDEHSVDSIAIGWWGLKKWIEENQPE